MARPAEGEQGAEGDQTQRKGCAAGALVGVRVNVDVNANPNPDPDPTVTLSVSRRAPPHRG